MNHHSLVQPNDPLHNSIDDIPNNQYLPTSQPDLTDLPIIQEEENSTISKDNCCSPNESTLGTIHPAVMNFFERPSSEHVAFILSYWIKLDQSAKNAQDETKAQFLELCTIPKAFLILKNFHLKLAQSDSIFNQNYSEKETQENDKHSSIIHKACSDGAVEQEITLLVNEHLRKQEIFETQFKEKFSEYESAFHNEYKQLVNDLYEQKDELSQIKLHDNSQQNLYQDLLSDLDRQPNPSILSNTIAGAKNNKPIGGHKNNIQLCLGLQKKRLFQIQIVSRAVSSIFSQLDYLKETAFDSNPYNNFIYGENKKTAIFNIINSASKFNHAFKKFFKFRTDLHFPSFFEQFQQAISQKGYLEQNGDVVVTRHSCNGKAHYMFTIVRKEESKKLDFSFLGRIIKFANQIQIKKIIIPIQFIIIQQKDLKTNSEILKDFCTALKRELQILSYDYSYTQQYLKKIQLVLPTENYRLKDTYEKIKDILLQILE